MRLGWGRTGENSLEKCIGLGRRYCDRHEDSDGVGWEGHSVEVIVHKQYDTGGLGYFTEKHPHLPDL